MLRPCCLTRWKSVFFRKRNARCSATMPLDGQAPTPFGATGLDYTSPVTGRHALQEAMFAQARNALGLPCTFHVPFALLYIKISRKL